MLDAIRITPLAEESLGVRSMCTLVETPDTVILLDPGVSLAPSRFGLPPHPEEFRAVRDSRRRILEAAQQAEVVLASHYHFDHITPGFKSWYEWTEEDTYRLVYSGKLVLAKDIEHNINFSQRRRGYVFRKLVSEVAREILVADGAELTLGRTRIKCTDPMPHGAPGTRLGWVVGMLIEHQNEKILYLPDVQGPMSGEALNWILSEKPDLVMIGGPPTYLAGMKVPEDAVNQGIENLARIAAQVDMIIVCHHLLRDIAWRERLTQVFNAAGDKGGKVVSAAEYLGREAVLLEAQRKELYRERPPSEEFMEWIRAGKKNRKTPPPI